MPKVSPPIVMVGLSFVLVAIGTYSTAETPLRVVMPTLVEAGSKSAVIASPVPPTLVRGSTPASLSASDKRPSP